jgi:type III pantothenate kinase
MKPAFVVDVGNTRIKWGRVVQEMVRDWASLPHDDTNAWQKQFEEWKVGPKSNWVIAGVQPQTGVALVSWLREKDQHVTLLDSWRQLPLKLAVDQPERVGMDRLVNGVAANVYRKSRRPAIVISAGTAITVDLLNEEGDFSGGAIFPGCTLMGHALHTFTAKLPLVQLPSHSDQLPFAPGKNTTKAMQLGIFWSIVGGIVSLVVEMGQNLQWKTFPHVFLTGGDAGLLEPELSKQLANPKSPHCCLPHGESIHLWPTMTLEGIRLSAEALP